MSSPHRRHGLAAALALLAAACGGERAPTWTPLAAGFSPEPLAERVAEWERTAGAPTGTTVEPQAHGVSLWHDVRAEDWSHEAGEDWSVALPAGAFRASGVTPRLVGRGAEYRRADPGAALEVGEFAVAEGRITLRQPPDQNTVPRCLLVLRIGPGAPLEHPVPSSVWQVGRGTGEFVAPLPRGAVLAGPDAPRLFRELRAVEGGEPEPFTYRVGVERVRLRWGRGERPPGMRLTTWLEHGRDVDGSWQLRLGRFCALGIPVWSGSSTALVRDVAPDTRLTFSFLYAARAPGETVRARLVQDGVERWALERAWAPGDDPVPASVLLAAADASQLVLELEGDPGPGALLAPVLGPAEIGAPGARPWEARPDVVLLLADTLRADALSVYGGAPDLAPRLNALADGSLVFTGARSNAAWTLPSIGTLLTGLQPGQHGATDEDLSLPAGHETLAERLHAAGYRTGAITDGSFFSPVFGLDQGFEWFSQRDLEAWDLDATVAEARAFLDRDDGRPVFLVVHTYRVHQPYRVGPDEDPSAYEELMARTQSELGTDSPAMAVGFHALGAHADELRALYEAGIRDLDRGFGLLLDDLERRRFFERGTLFFTSDHGEALGENEEFFHSGRLRETKLRVPLLLHGRGVTPGRNPHLASLVDVAPTIAALTGVPGDPSWPGTSLLALDHERPAFAFQLVRKNHKVAMIDGERKVIVTPETGSCEEAFHLGDDPGEHNDVCGEADWPSELAGRLAPQLERLLEARDEAKAAGVSAEMREQLDALGYGGEK